MVEVREELTLIPCHGKALSKLGTTSAISSAAYSPSRAWAASLHAHPDAPDGLRYRSRHDDDQLCIALFDRAAQKVFVAETLPLLDPATGVIDAIDRYEVAVK